MKALVVVLCLAGSGALWYWALAWPKAVAELDRKYRGEFELFRYEPPEGESGDDPIARGQRWIYSVGADHIYTIRVMVAGDFEMSRRSGVVTSVSTPEGDEFLVMAQHTVNSSPEPSQPERYLVEWGSDEKGSYLHLTGELEDRRGQQLFLRRIAE